MALFKSVVFSSMFLAVKHWSSLSQYMSQLSVSGSNSSILPKLAAYASGCAIVVYDAGNTYAGSPVCRSADLSLRSRPVETRSDIHKTVLTVSSSPVMWWSHPEMNKYYTSFGSTTTLITYIWIHLLVYASGMTHIDVDLKPAWQLCMTATGSMH